MTRSALEGERKQVTVLFADVKGSLALSEQTGPEDWHEILDRFFEILAEGIHRYEGTINQYTGDGIMALFGAPIAHEDHAQRACYAALHLSDTLRRYSDTLRVDRGLNFSVRIGLNSGGVFVGKIGDDLRMDYTAQGQTVGIAQRMEALAEAGAPLVGEATARLVEGYFDLRALGDARVKGVDAPLRIYALEGVGPARTRLDRARTRGLSLFVGRDEEMAILEAALANARAGEGQIVAIVAAAGTGKSRLCAEFLDRCRGEGLAVLEGHGVSYGKSVPFLPILELLRAWFGILDEDGPTSIRDKIAGRLLQMDESFRDSLPLIFDLVGVADRAMPSLQVYPQVRPQRLHELMRRVLHDPGYGATRVTLLEDLHWFDGGSDSFLDTLIESVPATRDLVIVTFRPEYQAGWLQRSYCQLLPLKPLGADAICELLRDLLGEDPSVAELPQSIFDRSSGNPFFTEEIVQSMIESGQLVGTRGRYQLAAPLTGLEIPDTVQSLLAARIDRLPEDQKAVLQIAAVIGKSFGRELLLRIARLPETALTDALSGLTAAEFLYEQRLYPELVYAFKHPLTQEVAEQSQSRERRSRIHAAVAETLQQTTVRGDNEQASAIARHWQEAGDPRSAAHWFARAAEWSGRTDLGEGLRHWQRVRELAQQIEDPAERSGLGIASCLQILAFAWRGGRTPAELEKYFEEGRRLALADNDRVMLARLMSAYGTICGLAGGSLKDYMRYVGEAGKIADAVGDESLRAATATSLAAVRLYEGRPHEIISACRAGLAITGADLTKGRALLSFTPRGAMLFFLSVALAWNGRLADARTQLAEGQQEAEEGGEREVVTWFQQCWAHLAYFTGGRESGMDQARQCFELAEKLGNGSSRVLARTSLGLAHMLEGHSEEAVATLNETVALVHELNTQRTYLPQILAVLSEAHTLSGRFEQARRVAEEAVAITKGGGYATYGVLAYNALARALLACNGKSTLADITAALDAAEALVARYDIGAFRPQVREIRAEAARLAGRDNAAERLTAEALAQYREIGAAGHAVRLSAGSGEVQPA
jgi:class 3 adenylate cyclase/tetratricopeptide (TPR) repeat protein